jgi:hypothetical protein
MISARRRSDTRRLILIGLFVSLIIHLLGGSVWDELARLWAHLTPEVHLASKEDIQARTDIIRLEHDVPPPPHHAAPPPPAAIEAPQPQPAEQEHELAHITIHAPHRIATPVHGPASATNQNVARPGAPKTAHPFYSDDQLAQMSDQFSKAISESHETLAEANAAAARPVQTIKKYTMHYQGIHEGMNPGDGIITTTKAWHVGNQNFYYVHYEYMYGDGHLEEGDVPWPFHYPSNDDPFARHDPRVALQGPPPDFPKPDPPLQPQLEQFFDGSDPFVEERKQQGDT